MPKLVAVLCSCLALGLLTGGCGSSSKKSNNGGGGATSTPAQTTTAAGGGGGAAAKVVMKNTAFSPTTITVKKGTTVTWTNDDPLGHDVTKSGGPGPSFKSGSPGGLSQGNTFSHTFNAAGTIKYVCTIHKASGMTGEIIVK